MAIRVRPFKGDRHRITLSDDAAVRHWVKALGKPQAEIEAAIAKVGDNPDTVAKELGVARAVRVAK